MAGFWEKLAGELSRTEPKVSKVALDRRPQRDKFDPHGRFPQLMTDAIRLPKDQLDSLKQTHNAFVQSIRELAPNMPFQPGSRGIVMTVSNHYLGIAITSLLMLRRAGSKLSVQLFLDSADDNDRRRCDEAVERLNTRCLSIDDFLKLPPNSTTTPKIQKYQFKVFALLFSSFDDILFLDADAFPVHRPDYLLDVEPYKSYGLVTWPDFWLPTVSPHFYKIAGVAPPNVTMSSRSSESGMMLYSKARHAESLLLATYYNMYGPDLYYPLHSQGAWGEGDKETFMLGARILGKPFWQVTTPPEFFTTEDLHHGTGIWQMDPQQDWLLQMWIKQQSEKPAKGEYPAQEYESENDKMPRRMFAHHNLVKIDAKRLSASVGKTLYKKTHNKYSRLWGPDSNTTIAAAGYDVEKVVWEEIIKANCQQTFLEECEKIKDYYDSVFVET